jgi:multidrug efflux pump subunit AcrB
MITIKIVGADVKMFSVENISQIAEMLHTELSEASETWRVNVMTDTFDLIGVSTGDVETVLSYAIKKTRDNENVAHIIFRVYAPKMAAFDLRRLCI